MPADGSLVEAGLVGVAREFLAAGRLLRLVGEQHRAGTLRFQTVRALVGDDEGAVLFRLKERCHALFRGDGDDGFAMGPEALFDLAVGSLFHEAMKFRENFYQKHAYGPKLRVLRESPLPEAAGLLPEFEKMLVGADQRIDEALEEALRLLSRTTVLFRALLRAHRSSGLLTRFLVEHGDALLEAFGDGLDALLADVHGSAGDGYATAARSYLASGFFAEADRTLARAAERGAPRDETVRLAHYARGMQAYLEGRYADVVDELEAFAGSPARPGEERLRALAHSAVSRLGTLTGAGEGDALAARAVALCERIVEAPSAPG